MSENREDIRNPEEGLIDIVGILKEYLQTLRRLRAGTCLDGVCYVEPSDHP